jgi:hypothetical protein
MVRYVIEVARYTKRYIRHDGPISGKLQYQAALQFWRCQINQLAL